MSTFRTTFKVLAAQKGMIMLYVVALGLLIFGLGWSTASTLSADDSSATYTPGRPEVALVNRDGTDGERLMDPMRAFLAEDCDLVDVGASSEDLQTAVASNYADLIVIMPDGFTQQFATALADGTDTPELEVVTSYTGAYGTLAKLQVEDFLRLTRIETLGATYGSTVDTSDVADGAQAVIDRLEDDPAAYPSTAVAPDPSAVSDREDNARIVFVIAVKMTAYPLLVATLICTALAMNAFGGTDVRRRLYASPRRTGSMVLQQFAACSVFSMLVSVLYLALAVALPAVNGLPLSGIPSATLWLSFVAMLVYGIVGVACGFMLSMLSLGSVAVNGFGNVFGLAVMFTSGMAFPLEMMPQFMLDIGKLMPGWWFCEAVQAVSGAEGVMDVALWWRDMGLVALFGVAFVCLGLVFSRYRRVHPKLSGASVTQLAEG